MKKYILLILCISLLAAACSDSSINEAQAIALVKEQYPEFKDYPSDMLPPRSISTERIGGVWHIAFVQEGSGRPIISAFCFKVTKGKTVAKTGMFTPPPGDTKLHISPQTCS